MTGVHKDNKGTGGSTADFNSYNYPAVPYNDRHFHYPHCEIRNYDNANEVGIFLYILSKKKRKKIKPTIFLFYHYVIIQTYKKRIENYKLENLDLEENQMRLDQREDLIENIMLRYDKFKCMQIKSRVEHSVNILTLLYSKLANNFPFFKMTVFNST